MKEQGSRFALRLLSPFKAIDEPLKHTADPLSFLYQLVNSLALDQPDSSPNEELGSDLSGRALCISQKANELGPGASLVTFRNV